MRYELSKDVAGDLDMSAQESRNNGFAPFKGNLGELCVGQGLDDLDVEVGYAPQTGCTDTKFSRVLFGIGNKFIQIFPRLVGQGADQDRV